MKNALVLAWLLLPLLSPAQTLDLSGEWRMSSRDDPANALPSTDVSNWTPVSLPLHHVRLAEGVWLRRTVDTPPGADTLVLGSLPPYQLYLDRAAQDVDPAPGPSLHNLPPSRPRITIAIRLGSPRIPGPNQPTVDLGPYLVTTQANAQAAAAGIRAHLLRQLGGPFALLGGVQITLAIALLVIWVATERKYSALFWIAMYMFYAAHNLLRFSLFADMPQTPRYIASILSVQIALAIVGWDSVRAKVALWIGYGCLLLALSANPSSIVTGHVNGFLELCAITLMAIGGWRASGQARLTALVACLYWLLPVYGVWTRTALVVETSTGFWPVLGLVNVPLTLAIVVLFMTRFAEDRRERTRLHTEFEAARAVQQLLLSESRIERGGLLVEAVYQPAQEVGGDFYYVLDEVPDRLILVIGDVAGKGLRAAMLVSLLIGVLRETRETSPPGILRALNTALLRKANSGFVTACCASFEPDGAMTIATAGHPSPFSGGSEIELAPALPLGCDADIEYVEQRVPLLAGAFVTFVSDGVLEAANAGGELFGFDRTREISRKPAQQIAREAEAWGQTDDITVVTVRTLARGV